MNLLEASMKGLEFRAPFYDYPYPVDFAITQADITLVMFAGWWAGAWGPGEGLELFREPCVADPTTGGKDPSVWRVQDTEGVALYPPADSDIGDRIALAREATDIYRTEYLQALKDLQGMVGEDLDLSGWVEMTEARPIIDPGEELRKQNLGLRKMGHLVLSGSEESKIDVLVLDEHGNAATAAGNEWLTVFAEEWATREDRPPLEDYLEWITTQRPTYTVGSLGEPLIEMRSGDIDEIAAGLLESKT